MARFPTRFARLERLYAACLEAKRLAVDPMHRSFASLRVFEPNLHQAVGDTAMNRFPRIFASCRQFLGDRKDLRILSFGCSTGEEVLTLRQYFPSAFIVGAEINRRSLRVCRALKVDHRISFTFSNPASLEALGPFDAIFCMAVLQRIPSRIVGDLPASLKKIYPFERFDAQVQAFDPLLRVGGVLTIHGKAYAFGDSSVADRYLPLPNAPVPRNDGPKYDRNSQRLPDRGSSPSVFIKTKKAGATSVDLRS